MARRPAFAKPASAGAAVARFRDGKGIRQGDAKARYNLGFIYENGRGVAQDYAEAVKWFRLAAEQGAAEAQYNLGVSYAEGRGVARDDAEAAKWVLLAAEQGDAKAQNTLGVMYAEGQGVARDRVQAYKWFNLAASQDSVAEKETRDKAVHNRDLAASKMTPAEIAEASRLARDFKPRR